MDKEPILTEPIMVNCRHLIDVMRSGLNPSDADAAYKEFDGLLPDFADTATSWPTSLPRQYQELLEYALAGFSPVCSGPREIRSGRVIGAIALIVEKGLGTLKNEKGSDYSTAEPWANDDPDINLFAFLGAVPHLEQVYVLIADKIPDFNRDSIETCLSVALASGNKRAVEFLLAKTPHGKQGKYDGLFYGFIENYPVEDEDLQKDYDAALDSIFRYAQGLDEVGRKKLMNLRACEGYDYPVETTLLAFPPAVQKKILKPFICCGFDPLNAKDLGEKEEKSLSDLVESRGQQSVRHFVISERGIYLRLQNIRQLEQNLSGMGQPQIWMLDKEKIGDFSVLSPTIITTPAGIFHLVNGKYASR